MRPRTFRSRLLLLLLAPFVFSSCVALFPSHRDLLQSDIGPYPDNYAVLIDDWMRVNLKDPYSVQDLSVPAPVQSRYWGGLLLTGGYISAYLSCVQYNAKNSFGGHLRVGRFAFWKKEGGIFDAG